MTVQMDQDYIDDNFTQDFVKRVFTKPARLTQEMQADLNAFMRILPYRVITKPYRVYREINEHKNDWSQNQQKSEQWYPFEILADGRIAFCNAVK